MFWGHLFCSPDPVYVALFEERFLPQLKCERSGHVACVGPVPGYLNEVLHDIISHVQLFTSTKSLACKEI
jgi:hypothetical protein